MNSATINQSIVIKQDAKAGEMVKGYAFTKLIHNIIREYGIYSSGTYSVDIDDLQLIDKKLLLSHVLDSGDYELACQNTAYLDDMLLEVRDYLQNAIDDECYTVYCENMEEMGMYCVRHPNNDECYWVRR